MLLNLCLDKLYNLFDFVILFLSILLKTNELLSILSLSLYYL